MTISTSSSNVSRAADRHPSCPVCTAGATRALAEIDARRYLRCTVCKATFVDPAQRPSLDAQRREYDLHRNDPDDPGYRRFLARLAGPLAARLPARARGLDYGCGPGPALAAMLREAGFDVETWDPLYDDRRAVLDRRYDFVTCTEVIEHLHDPSAAFGDFARLLVPGGWLGLMTQFQTDDARFANWHYRRDPTHVVFYRAETLRFIANRLGWAIDFPGSGVALLRKPDA